MNWTSKHFNIFCQTLMTIITKFSNDGGVVLPVYAMPWINCFHFNGPCVNYLISGSNPNPWGATAILMCKIGGAYEFSACHSSLTILKNFQLSSLIILLPKMAVNDINSMGLFWFVSTSKNKQFLGRK